MWSELSLPWRASIEQAWLAYCAGDTPIGAYSPCGVMLGQQLFTAGGLRAAADAGWTAEQILASNAEMLYRLPEQPARLEA